MRCDQCNKFVSFEEAEPEVDSLEVSETGNVTANVRMVNQCADCGQDLKEATFDFDADHSDECQGHQGEGHGLEIEENGVERTSKSGYFDRKKGFVSSYGRYAKTFYGVEVSYKITCECGELEVEGSFTDEVQASGMEELV
jgi:hypothetical protein